MKPVRPAIILVVILLLSLFQSCDKRAGLDDNCDAPPAPVISYNTEIIMGDTLRLHADTVEGAEYFWRGPNNFVSSEQNPALPAIGYGHMGTYLGLPKQRMVPYTLSNNKQRGHIALSLD